MRTTKKEFKVQVQEHIINCLSEEHGETVQEQLKSVIEEFNHWYGIHEQRRTPNRWMAFKDWMLGLPSCLNIEYTYYNIGQTLKSWFEACGAEYKEQDSDKEAELYYHLVIREFNALCRKNGLASVYSI